MMTDYIDTRNGVKIGQKLDLTRWYVAAENISDLQDARKRLETIKDTTPQNADFLYVITENLLINDKVTYTMYEKAVWKNSPNESGKVMYISGIAKERESQTVSTKELEKLLV